ncbi:MAG: hypothetical protein IPO95_04770 [Rhodanobacteraceae bacterium]|nr:hypothetical protein [Rhodanobacteraceae bacterium]
MFVRYVIEAAGRGEKTLELHLDPVDLQQVENRRPAPPAWALLSHHQCVNCPLRPQEVRYCPLALNLVRLVDLCAGLDSYEQIRLTVVTPERRVQAETTVQRGLSSLLGLITATSACPHTGFFRPMARFHLPLANEEETVYRAISTYLLAQYFGTLWASPSIWSSPA